VKELRGNLKDSHNGILLVKRNSGHCSLPQAENLTTLLKLDLLPFSDEARKGKRLL